MNYILEYRRTDVVVAVRAHRVGQSADHVETVADNGYRYAGGSDDPRLAVGDVVLLRSVELRHRENTVVVLIVAEFGEVESTWIVEQNVSALSQYILLYAGRAAPGSRRLLKERDDALNEVDHILVAERHAQLAAVVDHIVIAGAQRQTGRRKYLVHEADLFTLGVADCAVAVEVKVTESGQLHQLVNRPSAVFDERVHVLELQLGGVVAVEHDHIDRAVIARTYRAGAEIEAVADHQLVVQLGEPVVGVKVYCVDFIERVHIAVCREYARALGYVLDYKIVLVVAREYDIRQSVAHLGRRAFNYGILKLDSVVFLEPAVAVVQSVVHDLSGYFLGVVLCRRQSPAVD